MLTKYFLLLAVYLIALSTAYSQEPLLTHFRNTLAARNKLPASFHIVCDQSTINGNTTSKSLESFWIKGARRRLDTKYIEWTSSPELVGMRRIYCRGLIGEYSDYIFQLRCASKHCADIAIFTKPTKQREKIDMTKLNWRHFGLMVSTVDAYWQKPADGLLEVLTGNVTRVEERQLNGHQHLVLVSDDPAFVGSSIWFRPDQSMSMVRCEQSGPEPGFRRFWEATYEKLDQSDVWFPKKTYLLEQYDGVKSLEETVTIVKADFHSPVPDSVFTLEGMDLKEGQILALPHIKESKDYPTWRNGKIDYNRTLLDVHLEAEAFERKRTGQSVPVPDHALRRWPKYVVGSLLAFAGLGAGWYAFRKRSRA